MGQRRENDLATINSLLTTIVEMQKKEIDRLGKEKPSFYVNIKGNTTWANAPIETVKELLKQHYNGEISIYDYFGIGDEREMSLGGEINQKIQMVLTDREFYQLADFDAKCAFTVDQKNLLDEVELPMNENGTNEGGWKESDMRKYINKKYLEAFAAQDREIFKRFKLEDADTIDTFILRSEIELFGRHIYSSEDEPGKQIEYYKTTRNRVKCVGDDFGSAYYWWERSPRCGTADSFCLVPSDGTAGNVGANHSFLIAPAGCI